MPAGGTVLIIVLPTAPIIPSIAVVNIVRDAACVHHLAFAVVHPFPYIVECVVLVIDPLAATSEDGEAAASHLYGRTVILAHQSSDSLHAPVDDILDVRRGQRP